MRYIYYCYTYVAANNMNTFKSSRKVPDISIYFYPNLDFLD